MSVEKYEMAYTDAMETLGQVLIEIFQTHGFLDRGSKEEIVLAGVKRRCIDILTNTQGKRPPVKRRVVSSSPNYN